MPIASTFANAALEVVDARLVAFEILFHQIVVLFDGQFDQLFAPSFDIIDHIGGNIFNCVVHRIARFIPDPGFAGQQIDYAAKLFFNADRQHHHHRFGSEDFIDLLDNSVKICTGAIELIDVDDASDFGIVSVAPVGFRLRFNSTRTAEHTDTTIEHLQRTVNLDRKIDVSGGIDDVELMLVPEAGGSSGLNRNPALLLLFHEVSSRRAFVNFTNFVDFTCQFQDSFSCGGLASIYVGEDADISITSEIFHNYC